MKRTPSNIEIVPHGASGFVVTWHKTPADPVEWQALQNREQLIELLKMILDEAEADQEGRSATPLAAPPP